MRARARPGLSAVGRDRLVTNRAAAASHALRCRSPAPSIAPASILAASVRTARI